MTGYRPATDLSEAVFMADVMKKFSNVVQQHLHFQDKTKINWIPLKSATTAHPIVMMDYGDTNNVVIELVDYSDWFEINENQAADEIALKAGMGAVGAYNALLGAAMRKYGYGVYATELLQPDDNLKFTVRRNVGPSIADPLAMTYGWAAWRFKFGAGVLNGRS